MFAPPARRDDHVLEPQRKCAAKNRGLAQYRGNFTRRVTAARLVWHDEHARSRTPKAERDLAFAEDRHERAADGTDAQRCERDGDELDAVRKLIGNVFAGANAEI